MATHNFDVDKDNVTDPSDDDNDGSDDLAPVDKKVRPSEPAKSAEPREVTTAEIIEAANDPTDD